MPCPAASVPAVAPDTETSAGECAAASGWWLLSRAASCACGCAIAAAGADDAWWPGPQDAFMAAASPCAGSAAIKSQSRSVLNTRVIRPSIWHKAMRKKPSPNHYKASPDGKVKHFLRTTANFRSLVRRQDAHLTLFQPVLQTAHRRSVPCKKERSAGALVLHSPSPASACAPCFLDLAHSMGRHCGILFASPKATFLCGNSVRDVPHRGGP